MPSYEFFDHTADIGMNAFGRTQAELFENAARGLYATMGEFVTDNIAAPHRLEFSANDVGELLLDWLREIHFLFDTRRWVLQRVEWHNLDSQQLLATVHFAVADFEKSSLNEEIKAITYHCLKIEQTPDHWKATIILDV